MTMSSVFNAVDHGAYLRLAEDVRLVAEERRQSAAVSMIDRAVGDLGGGCFSLAVLGMVKRGKSSFCNALLGAKDDAYAPVGVNPVSNAVTVFRKGPPKAVVSFCDAAMPDETIDKGRIRQYITEQGNPGNRLGVASVTVQDAFPMLPDGVVLVDTPGEGSINDHHDRLLYQYLPSVDAAIFLITAQSPLTESEIGFLKEIQAQDVRKVFFAINRADQVDDDELAEAIGHNLAVLADNGIPATRIFPISAKLAQAGDIERSGFKPLFDEVSAYLDREKFRVPRDRFMARLAPIVTSLARGIDEEVSARLKTAEELSAEIKELTDKGTSLEEFQNTHLARVRSAWDAASAAFFTEVTHGLTDLENQLAVVIRNSRATTVKTLKAELAGQFETLARQKIETAIANFDLTVQSAVDSLPVQFGGLGLQTGAEGSRAAFAGGTSCGVGKLVLTGVLAGVGAVLVGFSPPLVVLGAVAGQFWNTTGRVKDELLRTLPDTVEKIRRHWLAQKPDFVQRREAFLAELSEQFQVEMAPTVQALEDALESQGRIDRAYDDRLKTLQGMMAGLKNVTESLRKEVSK